MSMRRTFLGGLAGLLLLVLVPTTAYATFIKPGIADLITRADAVVLGKVIALDKKPVSGASLIAGSKRKAKYFLATVAVEDGLLGIKTGDKIRVGVLSVFARPIGGRGPARWIPQVQLTRGQELLVFLTKLPGAKYYVVSSNLEGINKKEMSFAKDVEAAKKYAKLLQDPMENLSSKDADVRLLTAGLLINRYRPLKAGKIRYEPIDAKESKQILETLLQADWNNNVANEPWLIAESLFLKLGLTAKDGWRRPKNIIGGAEPDAKKWLKAHAGTYRIRRIVPAFPPAKK